MNPSPTDHENLLALDSTMSRIVRERSQEIARAIVRTELRVDEKQRYWTGEWKEEAGP